MSDQKKYPFEQKIEVKIQQDDQKMNKQITWSANNDGTQQQDAKAMFMSFWNGDEKIAYKVDLWTTEMTVEEMNHFIFQSFMTLADTFERATQNTLTAIDIKNFANEFGKSTGVLKEE